MGHFDLFGFYRFMLAVLAGTYTFIRLVSFVAGVGEAIRSASRGRAGSTVMYHYLTVLLLRTRLRGFSYELVVIGGLVLILILLIRAH